MARKCKKTRANYVGAFAWLLFQRRLLTRRTYTRVPKFSRDENKRSPCNEYSNVVSKVDVTYSLSLFVRQTWCRTITMSRQLQRREPNTAWQTTKYLCLSCGPVNHWKSTPLFHRNPTSLAAMAVCPSSSTQDVVLSFTWVPPLLVSFIAFHTCNPTNNQVTLTKHILFPSQNINKVPLTSDTVDTISITSSKSTTSNHYYYYSSTRQHTEKSNTW